MVSSIRFFVNLSSLGFPEAIWLGCRNDNFGEKFYMQISDAITDKSIFINIFKSIHARNIKVVSNPRFSRSRNQIKPF